MYDVVTFDGIFNSFIDQLRALMGQKESTLLNGI
jgi:hypothetical protein